MIVEEKYKNIKERKKKQEIWSCAKNKIKKLKFRVSITLDIK